MGAPAPPLLKARHKSALVSVGQELAREVTELHSTAPFGGYRNHIDV